MGYRLEVREILEKLPAWYRKSDGNGWCFSYRWLSQEAMRQLLLLAEEMKLVKPMDPETTLRVPLVNRACYISCC
jgi:hypothetical protein